MPKLFTNLYTQYKTFFIMGFIAGTFAAISYAPALARVIYPPAASLSPGDINTTHISDGTILNADISGSTLIDWDKISSNSIFINPSLTYSDDLFRVSSASIAKFTINHRGDAIFTGTASVSGVFEVVQRASISHFFPTEAQGDVMFRGAGNWQRLAVGGANTFLKSNGAGSDLTWGASSSTIATTSRDFTSKTVVGNSTTQDVYTKTIPANTMGPNGAVHARAYFNFTANNAAMQVFFAVNGANRCVAFNFPQANAEYMIDVWWYNRADTKQQYCFQTTYDVTNLNVERFDSVTGTTDTTAAQTLDFSWDSAATATIVINAVMIEIYNSN